MKKFLLKTQSKKAEASVGTAIAILTAVVVGALLMLGIYAIINGVVIPKTSSNVSSLFDYAG